MSENADSQSNNKASGSGRRQLTVILVIALVTLGGSYLLFYFASTGSGWGTTNNGEFVQPPTTIEALGWPTPESRNWRLWVVSEGTCTPACVNMVTKLRALHILLSKEAGRVRRAITIKGADSASVTLPEPFPKLERINPVQAAHVEEGVYIIDPNGNLVFRYALDVDPKLILDDLKKLLKLSQIG